MPHGKIAKWRKCKRKRVYSMEKVQHEKGQYEENMKSEWNRETWKDCNTKNGQHEKSETWRKFNRKKRQHENSATWAKYSDRVKFWKKCT